MISRLPLLALSLCLLAAGIALPLLEGEKPSPSPPPHPIASPSDSPEKDSARPPEPKTRSYTETLDAIASERQSLATEYRSARAPTERQRVLDRARQLFVRAVADDIIPYWYGTPWDFNGTTQTPGEGSIACGYFVTTVLRDAGLNLPRARLAQQPSETIIRRLTRNAHITRFSNVPIAEFVERVRTLGAGLYVVGLDIHVGFILNDGGEIFFIHSSYVTPRAVVRERAAESTVLAGSRYRVVGRISADDALLVQWLMGSRGR